MPEPRPRWNLIAHIRQQIAEGRYVTEGKLRIVADRLLRSDGLSWTTRPTDRDGSPPARRSR